MPVICTWYYKTLKVLVSKVAFHHATPLWTSNTLVHNSTSGIAVRDLFIQQHRLPASAYLHQEGQVESIIQPSLR